VTIEISVVTPTRNRAAVLVKCLRSLMAQSLAADQYEVIVVDDGSTDATAAALDVARRESPCEIRAFRRTARAGIPAARNLAIREARGELIVFVDSDELAPQRFLAAHLDCHSRSRADIICRGPVITTQSLEQPFDSRGAGVMDLSISYFDTDNASVRRSVLFRAGLFDESLQPFGWEGLDLGFRLKALGIRRVYRRDALIYHFRPPLSQETLEAMLGKEAERAKTARRFYEKHPTFEGRLAVSLTPFHRWLNLVQRGFGLINAGNALAWAARMDRWGMPGAGRLLVAGVLNERFLAGVKGLRAGPGANGRGNQRRHLDI
jgi:glycosyltransferase involved in cell wall biosynthesis